MNPIREAMKSLPGHWLKGATYDGNGNACGLGHLVNVEGSFGTSAAIDIMDKTAAEQYPDRITFKTYGDSMFGNFNDHPATTEDDVLRVMEKAAVRWDEIKDLTD